MCNNSADFHNYVSFNCQKKWRCSIICYAHPSSQGFFTFQALHLHPSSQTNRMGATALHMAAKGWDVTAVSGGCTDTFFLFWRHRLIEVSMDVTSNLYIYIYIYMCVSIILHIYILYIYIFKSIILYIYIIYLYVLYVLYTYIYIYILGGDELGVTKQTVNLPTSMSWGISCLALFGSTKLLSNATRLCFLRHCVPPYFILFRSLPFRGQRMR